jgi:hypothetical protein
MSEKRMEAKLAQLLDRVLAQRSGGWAETFKEAGVSADNRGVVLYIGNGLRSSQLVDATALYAGYRRRSLLRCQQQ